MNLADKYRTVLVLLSVQNFSQIASMQLPLELLIKIAITDNLSTTLRVLKNFRVLSKDVRSQLDQEHSLRAYLNQIPLELSCEPEEVAARLATNDANQWLVQQAVTNGEFELFKIVQDLIRLLKTSLTDRCKSFSELLFSIDHAQSDSNLKLAYHDSEGIKLKTPWGVITLGIKSERIREEYQAMLLFFKSLGARFLGFSSYRHAENVSFYLIRVNQKAQLVKTQIRPEAIRDYFGNNELLTCNERNNWSLYSLERVENKKIPRPRVPEVRSAVVCKKMWHILTALYSGEILQRKVSMA